MKEITLEAETRPLTTKGDVKVMRQKGRVPGIAYGDKETPVILSVDEKAVQGILHSSGGRNALITLKIGGVSHPVLIKEIQRHPITRALRHLDFVRISLKKKIETKVPLHTTGEAPGVKVGGGVLEYLVREIRVRCLPTEIPTSIDVDISGLQLNQGLRAKELKLPQGVEILMDAESVIVHVLTVHIVEETPLPGAVPEAGSTEPEVIKKGKLEEGEEGAAAAPGAKPAAGADKKAGAPAAAAGAKPASGGKPEAKKPEGK
jgi:large subunit ribosomal protein L25